MRSQLWQGLPRRPSICSRCQTRYVNSELIRPFSSRINRPTQKQHPKNEEAAQKQLLGTSGIRDSQIAEAPGTESPLAMISRMMDQKRTPQPVSVDYARMTEDLANTLIRQPYSDRSPPHHLHIYAHKHNTLITLTRPNGNPIFNLSCGILGFRKSQRSGYDPAFQLSSHALAQIQEKGLLLEIQKLELVFRGFGPGREAFTKVLLGNEGRNIRGLVSRVTDSTRIKFGGTRSRQVRRLG